MEDSNYKNENIEIKYSNNMPKTQFLKVNDSFLEWKKDFIKLKDGGLKDREVEIKSGMMSYFLPITVPINVIWTSLNEKKLGRKDLLKPLGMIGSLIIFLNL